MHLPDLDICFFAALIDEGVAIIDALSRYIGNHRDSIRLRETRLGFVLGLVIGIMACRKTESKFGSISLLLKNPLA